MTAHNLSIGRSSPHTSSLCATKLVPQETSVQLRRAHGLGPHVLQVDRQVLHVYWFRLYCRMQYEQRFSVHACKKRYFCFSATKIRKTKETLHRVRPETFRMKSCVLFCCASVAVEAEPAIELCADEGGSVLEGACNDIKQTKRETNEELIEKTCCEIL